MKAMVEVEVAGFTVPDAVIIIDGHGVEGEAVELKMLDGATLDRLCEDFRANVFKAAAKSQPPIAAQNCPKCGAYVP